MFSVISFRNAAVLVRDRSLKVACFNSGDAGWETDFTDLILEKPEIDIPSGVVLEESLQRTWTEQVFWRSGFV